MEIKSNGMTNAEYKRLIQSIRQEEERKEGMPLDIEGIEKDKFICQMIKLYEGSSNDFWERSLKLIKNAKSFTIALYPGYASSKQRKAYVLLPYKFISDFDFFRMKFKNNDLAKKLHTTYHEMRHLLQNNSKKLNLYDKFCVDLCSIYCDKYPKEYDLRHDDFYYEIDANIYGINKTISFFKRYPDLYEENKECLEKLKNAYEFDKVNFDFDEFMSGMIHYQGTIIYNMKGKQYRHTFINLLHNNIIPDIRNFHNPLKEKLLYSILSCPDYLRSIDYNSLSIQDKQEILDALKWKENELINKQRFNERFLYRSNTFKSTKKNVKLANEKLDDKIEENKEFIDFILSISPQNKHQRR